MKLLKILGGAVVGVAAVAAAPFTGGGSLLAGAAALGLGTATAIGFAVAAGIGGGILADNLFPDKKRTGIAILGMIASGKTTIFNFLRNENINVGTSKREMDEFEYVLPNGKKRIIKKSVDIGGGDEYVKGEYASMLSSDEYDVYFFVFNSFEYLNNLNYQRNVNGRLLFIYNKKNSNKKIILIGSYRDKFKISTTKVIEDIKLVIENKQYSSLFNENFMVMDLTDKSALKTFFNNSVFK